MPRPSLLEYMSQNKGLLIKYNIREQDELAKSMSSQLDSLLSRPAVQLASGLDSTA